MRLGAFSTLSLTRRVPHPSIFCLGGYFSIGGAKGRLQFKTFTAPVRQLP
jgi:hypothetical protein